MYMYVRTYVCMYMYVLCMYVCNTCMYVICVTMDMKRELLANNSLIKHSLSAILYINPITFGIQEELQFSPLQLF